jgi:hypothetical protein
MQVIEHHQDRLILRYQRSLIKGLTIGIVFALGGLFFCLLGLALIKQGEEVWVLPLGIGSISIGAGFLWIIKFPKVITFTFDKSKNCILWEQSTFQSQPVKPTLEIPINLIVGIEIATSDETDAATGYYPRLILDHVYWRILLDSDGSYQAAEAIARIVAQFLNVAYFPDAAQAPAPKWKQKISEHAAPYQAGWKYLEDEVERLQQYLGQQPQDAEAHQELGIALYFSNRSHHKEAISHLQQAERLFETQQQQDLAALAKIVLALVS